MTKKSNPTDPSMALMHELLKEINTRLKTVDRKVDQVDDKIGAQGAVMEGFHRLQNIHESTIAEMQLRLDRVEKRLGLVDSEN